MTTPRQQNEPSFLSPDETRRRVLLAYCIHAFSASGIVAGMFSLVQILHHHADLALLWLMAAQIIDGIDGPMARSGDVKRLVPLIDGNALDLMLDYVTCVAAPALFLFEFSMLPRGATLGIISLILVSGLMWMSRTDLETSDGFFQGFPAAWNLVVTSLWIAGLPLWWNAAICLVLVLASFSNWPIAHATQAKDLFPVTITITVLWFAAMVHMTVLGPKDTPSLEKWILLIMPLWWVVLGIRRTRRLSKVSGPIPHPISPSQPSH